MIVIFLCWALNLFCAWMFYREAHRGNWAYAAAMALFFVFSRLDSIENKLRDIKDKR